MIARTCLIACCALLLACTSTTRAPETGATSATTAVDSRDLLLVDDFHFSTWAHDGSGNHIDFDQEQAGDEHYLIAHHRAGPRPQATLRREVRWDLSSVSTMRLRLHSEADGPVGIALGFRTAKGAVFETAPQQLQPGWNVLDFDPALLKEGSDAAAWAAKRVDINRLLIQISHGEGARKGTLRFASLRCNSDGTLVREAPTRILDLTGPQGLIEKNDIATWTCRLDVQHRPPATPGQVPPLLRYMTALQARIVSPGGQVIEHRGFCTGIDDDGSYRYALRFAPWASGSWRIRFSAEGPADRSWGEELTFTVIDSERPSSVRVDSQNPHYFATSKGDFFWPTGQNVAWVGDPEPWLDELQAKGCNWTRVWICAWGIDLTVDSRLEQIDFAAAEELDRYLALAAERGIQVQLVMLHHGSLGWDWSRNPFNIENGGICVVPEDFWTDWKAKALFRRYAAYLVARYGAYASLMAWELWNEADLSRPAKGQDMVDWHAEMTAWLKQTDAHGRMITTSMHAPYRHRNIFADRNIDFEPAHRYSREATMTAARLQARSSHKPQFFAEYGSEWREERAGRDVDGLYLRQGLFAAWCQGLAGGCMPWWWDVHNRDHDLLRHAAQLRAFIGTGDFRSEPPTIERLSLGDRARCYLALQRQAAWGYICDPSRPAEPGAPPVTPLLPAGRLLRIDGLIDGAWQLSWWTGDGRSTEEPVTVQGSSLELQLPEVADDLAFRLLKVDAAPLQATAEEFAVGRR